MRRKKEYSCIESNKAKNDMQADEFLMFHWNQYPTKALYHFMVIIDFPYKSLDYRFGIALCLDTYIA